MDHTSTLTVCCSDVVTAADAEEGDWIRTFSRVVRLRLRILPNPGESQAEAFTAPFYEFSPTLKTLHVDFTFLRLQGSQISDLIRSFPLLQDLTFSDPILFYNDGDFCGSRTIIPLPSFALTGLLELTLAKGMENIVRRLPDLPNGLHFRKLISLWHHMKDLLWMTELVERRSHALECLAVRCYPPCTLVLVLR